MGVNWGDWTRWFYKAMEEKSVTFVYLAHNKTYTTDPYTSGKFHSKDIGIRGVRLASFGLFKVHTLQSKWLVHFFFFLNEKICASHM
jgi:hypothetical protein